MKLKKNNIILKEDHQTQKALEKLSSDSFKNFIRSYIQRVYTIHGEPTKSIFPVFRGLKYEYGESVNRFVANYTLMLGVDPSSKSRGQFIGRTDTQGDINLSMDPRLFYDSFLNHYQEYEETKDMDEFVKDMYYDIYSDEVLSVLLHEMQHAYDYYRSGGKFRDDKQSKSFYDKVKNSGGLSGMSPEQQTELKPKYLKLKHEVNARFAEALKSMSVEGLDQRQYVEQLKTHFRGWELMTPKIQKYLIRRASGHYHEMNQGK